MAVGRRYDRRGIRRGVQAYSFDMRMLNSSRMLAGMIPLLISLGFLAAEACAQDPDLSASSASSGDKLVTALDSLRRKAQIPGLSVAVVEHGKLVLARGLGYADLEKKIPATAETPYDIASVSKPISAVVSLKLAERGVIDLDRPIAAYSDWPEFCREFSHQPSIFARELRCAPPAHTLRHLLSHTATARPGDRFSYNPILYSWASRPIVAATGASFSDLVERYVFVPAEMGRSARRHRALPLPDYIAQDLAPPHLVDSSGSLVRAPELQPQGDGAAGGVISTVLDLAKFDIALDSGLLLSPESKAMMMSPARTSAGQSLPYGIGWWIQKYQGSKLVWHSGWWEDAYSALYLKVPERDSSLILLANSEGLWWDNPLEEAKVEESLFARAFLCIWLSIEGPPAGVEGAG